jgi:hypothetical protein
VEVDPDHALFTDPDPKEMTPIPEISVFAPTASNATCPLSFKKKFEASTVFPGGPPAVAKAGSLSLTTRVIAPVVRSDSRTLILPAAGCAVNATKCPAA